MPRRETPEVVFSAAADLVYWMGSVPVHRAPTRLRIALPGLTLEQRTRWERLLERSHNDCGCSAATAAFLASLLVGIPVAVVGWFGLPLLLTVLALTAGSIAALFVGKLLGLLFSRRKLQRHVARLVVLAGHRTTA